MKTTIYTCSGDRSPHQLVISYWANRYPENVDVWWPEITEGLPVTEESQVKVAIGLIGKIIVTVSPIIILTMLREVRLGRMSYMDLNIYCNGKSIDVWPEGEIDTWPGGFSMTRGHLLFDDN